ncbi:UDP-N-acetylmuramate:L-alanyl-gamma-D-glutamyl-meso-diaminopimelate ligase [Algicola sagamiensis]|uniref:UDP-N-acetylmuramate:L-alanyl-gamma-D-glutamyl- meso-diaminopimelate ligase n=1 Tax=Algicola sagamiensis TaxID=163869 RepID=UPI0003A73AC6|nr:UDP-N-acetylmuramate:L-alanyl-gamma-D-glutamyl-meso-diaminopimelate ligase [Algicola sagamiensis]
MHLHILGICGTFMGGIAAIAKEMGIHVTGSDQHVYPPMSTQLESLGIILTEGYAPAQLEPVPDLILIGNALSRGNPCVEYILEKGLPYMSGAQWLSEYVLREKWVLAIAGTHGKTTTSSILAWLLEYNGMKPGFLIGGVPENFGVSARLGEIPFFVIEADEYDSAFFDKRSKFIHYHPKTLILNNLEFDHADIFRDLQDIQRQFHHLMKIVPQSGKVIAPEDDVALAEVREQGIWSELELSGKDASWYAKKTENDCSTFQIYFEGKAQGQVQWPLIGEHNMQNALMAIAAARHVGVLPEHSIDALSHFQAPKRRLEKLGEFAGVTVYDDFAHHPTAIQTTLSGLRDHVGEAKIVAVLEARSNTMKMGIHKTTLLPSLAKADQIHVLQSTSQQWSFESLSGAEAIQIHQNVEEILHALLESVEDGDHILIMSNGGFDGLHQKLIQALSLKAETHTS